jgi:outer membrane cobalamin receptor
MQIEPKNTPALAAKMPMASSKQKNDLAKIQIAQGEDKRKAGMDMFVRTGPSGKGLVVAYSKKGNDMYTGQMEDANQRSTSNTAAYAQYDQLKKDQQVEASLSAETNDALGSTVASD